MTSVLKSSVNLLHTNKFKLVLHDLPNLEFHVTEFTTPNITYTVSKLNYRQHYANVGNDKLDIGDINVSFKVDDDLNNYIELWNWLKGLGKPHTYEDRKRLNRELRVSDQQKNDHVVGREASFFFLNNMSQPNVEMVLTDVIPTSLSGISMTTKTGSDITLEANVTLSIGNMEFKK